MRGTSKSSLTSARERLAAALADGVSGASQAASLGGELFAVTGLLDSDANLRRTLSDPSRPAGLRAGLVQELLRGKISDVALEHVAGLVRERWSEPRDLADAAEELAVMAVVESASKRGELDDTEDQLFRFGRIVQASPDLRSALSSPFVPASRRLDVVAALLRGKANESASELIGQVAAHPRGRSLDASLNWCAALAARRRHALIAQVQVAVAMTAEQRARLTTALTGAYGRDVHLNVVVDPQILGGMTVRIGDEIIDGSAATRLAALRRSLAA